MTTQTTDRLLGSLPGGSRKTVPIDRKAALCGLIDLQNSLGLEFGPLSRPIVRREDGDIRYVDHATTEDLKIKYAVNDGHDVSEFVDISYVWDGGGLRKAIPDAATFDYALASHVVEHVPDVIGWLNDIGSVLKPGGLIGLAIPDKRYTFDVLRDVTTVSQLIDNHLRQIKRPVAGQVFDHFANVSHVGVDEIHSLWGKSPVELRRIFSLPQALSFAKDCQNHYVDCHASVFTPMSFLTALETIRALGLLKFEVADFYDTRELSQEFVVILRKEKIG